MVDKTGHRGMQQADPITIQLVIFPEARIRSNSPAAAVLEQQQRLLWGADYHSCSHRAGCLSFESSVINGRRM